MTTADTDLVCRDTALEGFLKAAQQKVNDRYAPFAPSQSGTLSAH